MHRLEARPHDPLGLGIGLAVAALLIAVAAAVPQCQPVNCTTTGTFGGMSCMVMATIPPSLCPTPLTPPMTAMTSTISAMCFAGSPSDFAATAVHLPGSGPYGGISAQCVFTFSRVCSSAPAVDGLPYFTISFTCSAMAPGLPVELMDFSIEDHTETEGDPAPQP